MEKGAQRGKRENGHEQAGTRVEGGNSLKWITKKKKNNILHEELW